MMKPVSQNRWLKFTCLTLSILFPFSLIEAKEAPDAASYQYLYDEPYLNPAGAPSADVLRKDEKFFAPQGWLSYGMTDHLTGTFDWLVGIFGVPALGARYELPQINDRFTHALDAYLLVFTTGKVETIKVDDEFKVRQKGWQSWLHYTTTFRLSSRWRWHNYAGATYDTYQEYLPKREARFSGEKFYKYYFIADYGTGLEYSPRVWCRMAANIIQGNNFYVYDQNPQHWLVQYSLQFKPFYRSKYKILSTMRLEMFGFYVKFPQLNHEEGYPPFYPLVYWQW